MAPPEFKGYRPYGAGRRIPGHVDLLYEEYEAIKLADYDLLNHQEASDLMGVSRPTFARIYESARRKIARALVETREIRSVFGNQSWFVCNSCQSRFTLPGPSEKKTCPMCKSDDFIQVS